MNETNIVGVDTHKSTLACYVNGKFKEFKTTLAGFKQATKWVGNKKIKWAIEGAYCFGQPFSAYLIQNGYEVYEVNPLLTKTWRGILSTVQPKNDYGDAKVISLFANSNNLQTVSLEMIKLKEITTTRRFLIKERTRLINNLKMSFFSRGDKLPFNDFTTKKAIKWFEEQNDFILKTQGNILKQTNEAIKKCEKELEENIPNQAKKLLSLKGISTIRAIEIIIELKGKVPTEKQLASYCGVAPVEQSSGKTKRFKTNKKGNRRLNSIFYSLSIAQKRYNPIAKEYYEKKLKEGKTPRHARKCLARQLVKVICKLLKED